MFYFSEERHLPTTNAMSIYRWQDNTHKHTIYTYIPSHVTSSDSFIRNMLHHYELSMCGGPSLAMWPHKPFFCFVQVSVHYSTIKSDYRGLLVLPCPRQCLEIACEVLFACKLLLCGDIKVNPGPNTEALLTQLLEEQNKLVTKIATLRNQQTDIGKMISDLNERFSDLERRVSRVDSLEQTVKLLQAKVVDLEDRSRRSNLIIIGIQEDRGENETALRTKVIEDLFCKRLNVTCCSIARIHRIGKAVKKRPVIVFFQNYNEKQEVLRNARKLKGTSISIQYDYSAYTLRKRKLLWQSAKMEKEQGKKVTLLHDKLRIDNDLYAWDDANYRVELVSRQRTSRKN